MSDSGYGAPTKSVFDDAKTMPVVVHALYLLGFLTGGVSVLVGLVLAYAGSGENDWRRSHYQYAVRTFWLTLAAFAVLGGVMLIGFLLTVTILGAIVGVPLMILAGVAMAAPAIWFAVRAVVALLYAVRGESYPRPRALLV